LQTKPAEECGSRCEDKRDFKANVCVFLTVPFSFFFQRRQSISLRAGAWARTCQSCTFINDNTAAIICEMCSTPLPVLSTSTTIEAASKSERRRKRQKKKDAHKSKSLSDAAQAISTAAKEPRTSPRILSYETKSSISTLVLCAISSSTSSFSSSTTSTDI